MITVAIIGLLAALAVPSFLEARKSEQRALFINDLRTATDAFEMYAADHGKYPLDGWPGSMPTGMAIYLGKMNFMGITPIGGQWDWDAGYLSTAALSVVSVRVDAKQMQLIDQKIDDGNLTVGGFVSRGSRYSLIIQN